MVARVGLWRFHRGDVVSANEDYLCACVWKLCLAEFLLKTRVRIWNLVDN